jgi:hypothetical protein
VSIPKSISSGQTLDFVDTLSEGLSKCEIAMATSFAKLKGLANRKCIKSDISFGLIAVKAFETEPETTQLQKVT